ncbi:hypothetical protein JKP88DRAFT_227291 [Tribonema minus]|uniref:HIT-type domain-containing protein n=1 Tax=Tribonema minus TaxID=303371 RepID=A0A835YLN6_9STRA|nr:hypothetical protein JKP88DRAFT_227291 [Tribonema minus]
MRGQQQTHQPGGKPAAAICHICNQAPSKYRCAGCDARYCSVACFKTHKAGSTGENGTPVRPPCTGKRARAGDDAGRPAADNAAPAVRLQQQDGGSPQQQQPYNQQHHQHRSAVPVESVKKEAAQEEEAGWQLTDAHRAQLSGSEWLRAALRDPKLQTLILQIDGARNREAELRFHRTNPEFSALMDRILLEMGLLNRSADGNLEFVPLAAQP